jgi:Fe-S cluster assembly protein SufD
MSGFLEKAQSRLGSFGGLPHRNHPLWKGFPLQKWEKVLDAALEEREAAVPSPSPRGSVSKETFDFSLLPFSVEDFSVLLFRGEEVLWLKDRPSVMEARLNTEKRSLFSDPDSFAELSLALAHPGLFLKMEAEAVLEKPLLCLLDASLESGWESLVHFVEMGARSKAAVVFYSLQNQGSPTPLRTHFVSGELKDSSVLTTALVSGTSFVSKQFHRFDFFQKKDSRLEVIDLGKGIGFGRGEYHVELLERGASAQVSGIHLLNDHQIYDTRVRISHAAPETYSRQNFKCVVSGSAQSLYGGSVIIQKDAQKSDSSQSHKALLVAPAAKASAFPELEVHADDVKATHGSSTGQMNPEEIFYLKSRALSQGEAVHLLSEAFVKDVVLKISDAGLRLLMESLLEQALPDFVRVMESRWRTP